MKKKANGFTLVELLVLDLINGTHAALAKKADYPVGTNFMSSSKRHSFRSKTGQRYSILTFSRNSAT
jgi:Tfp pilus assembly protein PilE